MEVSAFKRLLITCIKNVIICVTFFKEIVSFFFFQSHTILLVQPNQRPETRTYSDYESLNECLEGNEKRVCLLN